MGGVDRAGCTRCRSNARACSHAPGRRRFSAIGTARRVEASRSWSHPRPIWGAIVGASGTGKTPGIDATKRALSWIDRLRKEKIAKLALEHQTKAEAANAERKLWKKQVEEATAANRPAPAMPASATDPGVFVAPRLYVSDATIERMAVLLQANPRGMLRLSDELSGLFLNMSRYSGGQDNEFWLEAWNGNPYLVERMSRPPAAWWAACNPTNCLNLSLPIWMACTPEFSFPGHRSPIINRSRMT